MVGFLKKIIGDSNEREVKRLWKLVEEINGYEEKMSALTDSQMGEKTLEFKQRLANGETEQDLLPEAFALVREAAERMTGMRPFDVQLLGGIVLHQGRIAEMKTGEGKTLVATMPAYLNALGGKGVHIVTVNDYLARRDSGWMGPVFKLLGLTVGLIAHGLDTAERREAYGTDVVYGTNNEFGFDYLRDNMVTYKEQMVQRELNYAIIDEVDSILIDEARTPLIISSRVESRQDYRRWQKPVESLIRKQLRLVGDALNQAQNDLDEGHREEAGEALLLSRRGAPRNKKLLKMLKEPGVEKLVERVKHRYMAEKQLTALDEELYFSIDEATRNIAVSQKGYRDLARGDASLMQFLGFEEKKGEEDDPDPDAPREEETGDAGGAGEHLHTIHQLLKAYSLYEKDVDYVVQDGKIIIVDEFTGRLMWGRRYSDGLHQAIEAREGVEVQGESRTVASITFQNYFRMYGKLSGMTGTAATEEDEFRKIYGMDVLVIPTNQPMIRHDLSDSVYKTERAKFNAAVEEIIFSHEKGQPVLVGTISVEKSEMLSRMLKRRGVPHHVLNAVNHEQEAGIIAQAGRKGAVTISTNMAGRGTDIILGGNPEHMALENFKAELRRQGSPIDTDSSHEIPEEHRPRFMELLVDTRARSGDRHREVVDLGGLHVIGTERHESRRIDNQLRGRSGRQGDPGSSHFFVSLEDDLMRLFGAGTAASIMDRLGLEEDQPIDHPLIGRAIQNAQKKVEMRNFEIRRHLLDYDDVLNRQREIIYSQRRKVLEGESLRDVLQEMVTEVIGRTLGQHMGEKSFMEEDEARELLRHAESSFLRPGRVKLQDIVEMTSREIEEIFAPEARAFYEDREKKLGSEIMRELERVVLLRSVDRHWVEHIDAMHDLRQEINLRAYGQRDPLVEYRHESFEMFEGMIQSIQAEVVRNIYQAEVLSRPERRAVVSGAVARRPDQAVRAGLPPAGEEKKTQPVTVTKVGRNEPCPCGSGKKYKKCCGRES